MKHLQCKVDFYIYLFVCLFVCLFLSYIRPAFAWEHAGVYLGMAITITSIFELYKNYLGKFTDVLFRKLSKPVFAVEFEIENRINHRIICMKNENECLTFIFVIHAIVFFDQKTTVMKKFCFKYSCFYNNFFVICINANHECLHNQSNVYIIFVEFHQMFIKLLIELKKQI